MIYGNPNNAKYDGVHFRGGTFAERHFTYRAVQTPKPLIKFPFCEINCPQQQRNQQKMRTNQRPVKQSANGRQVSDSSRSTNERKGQSWEFPRTKQNQNRNTNYQYADVLKGRKQTEQAGADLVVPTSNFWTPLNC